MTISKISIIGVIPGAPAQFEGWYDIYVNGKDPSPVRKAGQGIVMDTQVFIDAKPYPWAFTLLSPDLELITVGATKWLYWSTCGRFAEFRRVTLDKVGQYSIIAGGLTIPYLEIVQNPIDLTTMEVAKCPECGCEFLS